MASRKHDLNFGDLLASFNAKLKTADDKTGAHVPKGNAFAFPREGPTASAKVDKPCIFFSIGKCTKGADCGFLHGGLPAAEYVAAAASGRPPRPTSARPSSAQRPPRPAAPPATPPTPQAPFTPARPPSAQRPPRPAASPAAAVPTPQAAAAAPRHSSAQRPPRPAASPAAAPPSPVPSYTARSGSAQRPERSASSSRRPTPQRQSSRSSLASSGSGGGGTILGGTITQQQMQKGFLVHQGDSQLASGHMTVTRQVVVSKPPLVVHAYFLLDASGSMAGSRMEATLEYLAHMVKVVLDDDDLVTVWTFTSDEKLTQLYYKTRAVNLDLASLRAKVKAGGGTRLYGNCVRALDSMRKDNRVRDDADNTILRNLIVFTDGCDTESGEEGLRTMVSELKNHGLPHFYFTCMAVSEEGVVQGRMLERELAGAKRAKVILTNKASKEEIAQAFGKAQACLREAKQELIERITLECRSNGKKPMLADALSGVAASLGRRSHDGSGMRRLA